MRWRDWVDVWTGHRAAPRGVEAAVVWTVDAVVWARGAMRNWPDRVQAWVEGGAA